MESYNKKRAFVIVFFDLVEAGLSYEEAAIIQYVIRFEKSKKPCFASIPYIAKDLRLSERTTKRLLRKLINTNFLQESGRGRGRFLTTNGAKMAPMTGAKVAPVRCQNGPDRCQNGTCEWCQNGPLSIVTMIKSNTSNNLSRSNLNNINNNNNNTYKTNIDPQCSSDSEQSTKGEPEIDMEWYLKLK